MQKAIRNPKLEEYPMIDLSGKVALVTGSSRGIGKGIALEMAAAGADVAVNYRQHRDEAEAVAETIRTMGRRALVAAADVADRGQVDRMVAQTAETMGRLDIAVANAYYSKREPFLTMSVEEAQRTMEVTFWGAFHLAQSAARQMAAQGQGGCLLFISSVMSFLPYAHSLAYSAAKAGMNHMAAIIAIELLPHRIRVNVIEPGWTDTPGERQFSTEEQIREGGRRLPWGRLGTIEDIGRAAAFLCSDAADYITGEVLRVDGGFWLQRGVGSSQ
jgi:glucose 1-dehydrogenase